MIKVGDLNRSFRLVKKSVQTAWVYHFHSTHRREYAYSGKHTFNFDWFVARRLLTHRSQLSTGVKFRVLCNYCRHAKLKEVILTVGWSWWWRDWVEIVLVTIWGPHNYETQNTRAKEGVWRGKRTSPPTPHKRNWHSCAKNALALHIARACEPSLQFDAPRRNEFFFLFSEELGLS